MQQRRHPKQLHVKIGQELHDLLNAEAERRPRRSMGDAARDLLEDGLRFRRLRDSLLKLKLTDDGAAELRPIAQ